MFRRVIKRALLLWMALVFMDVFMLETSRVVETAGWHVALERFSLVVVMSFFVSLGIAYRLTSGMSWYRKF